MTPQIEIKILKFSLSQLLQGSPSLSESYRRKVLLKMRRVWRKALGLGEGAPPLPGGLACKEHVTITTLEQAARAMPASQAVPGGASPSGMCSLLPRDEEGETGK